jgi:hypothetical protein
MLEWMLFRAIMVAFFILANSFFVAAEFALISVRETRMQQLLALGRPGARTALHLKQNIDDFLPAVQFGVTLASLALGWLGEPAVAEMILALASSPSCRRTLSSTRTPSPSSSPSPPSPTSNSSSANLSPKPWPSSEPSASPLPSPAPWTYSSA